MQENPRITNSLPFLFAVYFSVPRLAFSSEKNPRESLGFIFFLSFSLKLPTNLRWSVRIEILYRGSQSCQENIMNVARISKTYPQRRRWATHIAPLVCLWGACGPELQQRGIFSIVYNRSFIWKKNHLSITKTQMMRLKWEMNDHSKIFLGRCTAVVCLRRCHILVILQQLLKKFIKIEWRTMQ